jgi:polyisoprenoid-binding protein YceI
VPGRMRRGLVIGAVVVAILFAAGGAATWLLGSHHAPAPLALGSPTAATTAGGTQGAWKVSTGSQVGYRVKEQFINQRAPTEAVARTSNVSGGLQITGSGASLQATHIHFSADLASLQSQDKYATYQVYQRDFFIRSIYLQTDQFPMAVFDADSVAIPAGIASGPVTMEVAGRLNVHGVTKPVTSTFQAQLSGSGVEVAGSMTVDMRDFGIEPPDISFTKAQPAVVIEFHLVLVHA